MFLFIGYRTTHLPFNSQFKYISCSYLSYPDWNLEVEPLEFKYISCSYLSQSEREVANFDIQFKYISCSYLSLLRSKQIQFLFI